MYESVTYYSIRLDVVTFPKLAVESAKLVELGCLIGPRFLRYGCIRCILIAVSSAAPFRVLS